jgi:ABC-type amino acid transport substrate-binding protein
MLWRTAQYFDRGLFEKEIDLKSAIAELQRVLCGKSRVLIAALGLGAVLARAPETLAQVQGPPEARELIIGTKVAPPFAMKAEDGTWHGISIDLWRHISDQTHLRYRFRESTRRI